MDLGPGAARGEGFARRADLWLLAVAGCAGVVGLVLLLGFRFGRDQGIYAAVADVMLGGGVPYRDAWDFKPPAIFAVYALARASFGGGMASVRILEALGLLSLVPAFGLLSRRFLGDARAGLLAAALAVFAQVQLEYWDTAQPESFGGIAVVWALVCATGGAEAVGARRRQLAWAGAGLLYACAGLFKPHLGGGLLVSLGFACAAPPRSRGAAGRAALAMGAGAALPVALVAGGFALAGAWGDLVEVFRVFLPAYHALRFDAAALPGLALRALGESLIGFSALLPAGLALLVALPPLAPRERSGALHVALVGGVQLLGVALQARFYPYHFGATLTLWSLLAGWGLWKGWLRLHRSPLPAAAGLLLLALLSIRAPDVPAYGALHFWERARLRLGLLTGEDRRVEGFLHSAGDVHYGADRRAAEWIGTRTPDTSSLYVWGFEPVLYGMADRRPASRYVYNVPQRLDWPGRERARRRLLEDLAADPPAAIVVVARDVREGVTGSRRDSLEELEDFPALRELIEERYARAWRVEDLVILLRRP